MHGLTLFWFASIVASSQLRADALPTPARPIRPITVRDMEIRRALALYGLGLQRQHQDRLVEATKHLEEARLLDPDSAAIRKAVVPLYLALSRMEDALAESKKALELNPGDHELWALYARQLRGAGRGRESLAAYRRATQCIAVEDVLELQVQYYYDLGVLLEELKEHELAVEALAKVVSILDKPKRLLDQGDFNPKELAAHSENTYEKLIKICIDAKWPERATEWFVKARERHPKLAERLHFHMARLDATQGRDQAALEHLRKYLLTQPTGSEAYELMLSLHDRLGKSKQALALLKTFAEQDNHNLALQLLLAREAGKRGDPQLAEDVYQRLAEKTPTPDIYHGLFTLYRQTQGERGLERILRQLNKCFSRAPKEDEPQGGDPAAAIQARAMLHAIREDELLAKALLPVAQARLADGDKLEGQTIYFMAVLAARAKQLEAAERFYRGFLRNSADGSTESKAYGGLIQVLFQARKYADVVEICRIGLKNSKATNHLYFHETMARALVYLGQKEEAVAQATMAVEKANDELVLDARLARVSILNYAEQYQSAITECESLLKDHAQPGELHKIRFALYSVYASMKDHSKAEAQLRIILRDSPMDATANNDLGYLWADQGKNLDEAEALIRKALALDGQARRLGKSSVSAQDDVDNASFLDSLGWVLFRKGNLVQARIELEKAAALADGLENAVIWDHLGDVLWRLENKPKALAAWRKSLQLYESDKRRKPDEHYKELKQKLQQLEAETPRP